MLVCVVELQGLEIIEGIDVGEVRGESLECCAEVEDGSGGGGNEGVERGEEDPTCEGVGGVVEEGADELALVCEVVLGGALAVVVGGGSGEEGVCDVW